MGIPLETVITFPATQKNDEAPCGHRRELHCFLRPDLEFNIKVTPEYDSLRGCSSAILFLER